MASSIKSEIWSVWLPVLVILFGAWYIAIHLAPHAPAEREPIPLYIVPGEENDGYVDYLLLDKPELIDYCLVAVKKNEGSMQ